MHGITAVLLPGQENMLAESKLSKKHSMHQEESNRNRYTLQNSIVSPVTAVLAMRVESSSVLSLHQNWSQSVHLTKASQVKLRLTTPHHIMRNNRVPRWPTGEQMLPHIPLWTKIILFFKQSGRTRKQNRPTGGVANSYRARICTAEQHLLRKGKDATVNCKKMRCSVSPSEKRSCRNWWYIQTKSGSWQGCKNSYLSDSSLRRLFRQVQLFFPIAFFKNKTTQKQIYWGKGWCYPCTKRVVELL